MSKLVRIDAIDRSPWADLFPHDEEHVARLAEDIAERGIQTPLHVYPRGDRYELLSGHDRLEAAKRAGLTEVPCDTRSMLADEDERFAYFLKDNTLRKDVDKRAVALAVLKAHPEWSNRRVASVAACSEGTVRIVREDGEANGVVRNVTHREGNDGVTQPARKPASTGSIVGRKPKPEPKDDFDATLESPESVAMLADMAREAEEDYHAGRTEPMECDITNTTGSAPTPPIANVPASTEPMRRALRRPVDGRIRELISAAQAMRDVDAHDLAALETNDLMVEGLRVAVEQINRIITLHANAGARHANS